MKKVNISLRPDNCKVVFEKLSDHLFFGTLHPDYELSIIAKGQIDAFREQGFSIIIVSKWKKSMLFLAQDHTEEQISEEYKKILINRKIWP